MIATPRRIRYALPVTAKSVTEFGDSNYLRRRSATIGAFFMANGGCALWETARSAGYLRFRFANPVRTVTALLFGDRSGDSTTSGVMPMGKNTLYLSPRKARAAAHRKMAMSALWRDSSAKCRLERYNHHMAIARRLESEVAK